MRQLRNVVSWGIVASGVLGMTGCTNMSGIAGDAGFGCKAPLGVRCESMSATYGAATEGRLPSQQAKRTEGGPRDQEQPIRNDDTRDGAAERDRLFKLSAPSSTSGGPLQNVYGPLPIRSQSTVLRLWFKPWEDTDRDLWDQGYVYVVTDPGRWRVEHARQRVRDAYLPIRPPVRAASSAAPKEGEPIPARPPVLPARPEAGLPSDGLSVPSQLPLAERD